MKIILNTEFRARLRATLMIYGLSLSSYTGKSDWQLINLYRKTRGDYYTARLLDKVKKS